MKPADQAVRSPRLCQWPHDEKCSFHRIVFECDQPAVAGRPYCERHCSQAYVATARQRAEQERAA